MTESESMFANMGDKEWNARVEQNENDWDELLINSDTAMHVDPNKYFDTMDTAYANKYVESNGNISDEQEKAYNDKRTKMEEIYRENGWQQDKNGKWFKNGNN